MTEPRAVAATTEEIARRLYQVYSQHADWKDYRGEPLPSFDEMRETTRAHWIHVAEDICLHGIDSEANARRVYETLPPMAEGRSLSSMAAGSLACP